MTTSDVEALLRRVRTVLLDNEHDLISQHYGVGKSDLIAVLDLASSALDGRHAVPN